MTTQQTERELLSAKAIKEHSLYLRRELPDRYHDFFDRLCDTALQAKMALARVVSSTPAQPAAEQEPTTAPNFTYREMERCPRCLFARPAAQEPK